MKTRSKRGAGLHRGVREDWSVRTIGQLLPSFNVPAEFVILAGKLYANALARGAHWHNLARPEEPFR